MTGLFAQLAFMVLTAMTPHCHAGDVTDCHYSDSVSYTTPAGVFWAEVHHGRYETTFYPS